MAEVIDMIKMKNGYAVSSNGNILVHESYLVSVFSDMDWLVDKHDSNELCDIAANEGFLNLGDFGNGFVFLFSQEDMNLDRDLECYFEG